MISINGHSSRAVRMRPTLNVIRRIHKITMDGAKWLASVLCSTEIENPMYELWASRCLSIRDLMTSQKRSSLGGT